MPLQARNLPSGLGAMLVVSMGPYDKLLASTATSLGSLGRSGNKSQSRPMELGSSRSMGDGCFPGNRKLITSASPHSKSAPLSSSHRRRPLTADHRLADRAAHMIG